MNASLYTLILIIGITLLIISIHGIAKNKDDNVIFYILGLIIGIMMMFIILGSIHSITI